MTVINVTRPNLIQLNLEFDVAFFVSPDLRPFTLVICHNNNNNEAYKWDLSTKGFPTFIITPSYSVQAKWQFSDQSNDLISFVSYFLNATGLLEKKKKT